MNVRGSCRSSPGVLRLGPEEVDEVHQHQLLELVVDERNVNLDLGGLADRAPGVGGEQFLHAGEAAGTGGNRGVVLPAVTSSGWKTPNDSSRVMIMSFIITVWAIGAVGRAPGSA